MDDDGGDCDKQGLMMEVKEFLNCKEYDYSHIEHALLESYIEIDDNQFASIMNERLCNMLRERYIATNTIRKNVNFEKKHGKDDTQLNNKDIYNKDCEMEAQLDEISNAMEETIEDIIGEQVDAISFSQKGGLNDESNVQEIPVQEKDNGDKNLEMLSLLKRRKNSSSKKRSSSDKSPHNLQSKKRMKGHDEVKEVVPTDQNKAVMFTSTKKNDLNEKEKKKPSKKKKKKSKKDVIDDIFDGL